MNVFSKCVKNFNTCIGMLSEEDFKNIKTVDYGL